LLITYLGKKLFGRRYVLRVITRRM